MTKEQMIEKIYEVIADKTLSFGCGIHIGLESANILSDSIQSPKYIVFDTTKRDGGIIDISDITKIIGHPVMINRVDWYFKKNNRPDLCVQLSDNDLIKEVSERPEECIKHIYSLLPTEGQTKE